MNYDMLNVSIPGAPNFSWAEALYLKTFNIYVMPSERTARKIIEFAKKAQMIREYLNSPMVITSWLRPERYNHHIGGALQSAHMDGIAIDFICPGVSCDTVRNKLSHKLDEFDIRMEKLPGSRWVHIDGKKSRGDRYFKP